MATVFRAKVLDATRAAGLSLPPSFPADWVARCKAVGDGQKALLYLSRYLHRSVIREADILRCDAQGIVTFQYRDAKTGKMAQLTLPGADFLRHVLQHVLPRGFRRSRNFGLLHPNSAGAIRLLQVLHPQVSPGHPALPAPERPTWRCACGQLMHVLRRRMPPLQAADTPKLPPLRVKLLDKPNDEQGHTMQSARQRHHRQRAPNPARCIGSPKYRPCPLNKLGIDILQLSVTALCETAEIVSAVFSH